MAKILVSLPDTLRDGLDKYCDEHEYNRSELIRHMIRQLIEKEPAHEISPETFRTTRFA